jgi:hypothetical protein
MKKSPRQYIEEAIEKNGPYSHNIIGLALNQISKEEGVQAANDLMDEYDLSEFGFVKL